MKKSIAWLITALCAAPISVSVSAESGGKPETQLLPASEYRKPLDEIVVEGKQPYWQGEAPPRWDRPKVDAPKIDEDNKSRLQLAPAYTQEERDDYKEPRDTSANPKPRAKIVELKF